MKPEPFPDEIWIGTFRDDGEWAPTAALCEIGDAAAVLYLVDAPLGPKVVAADGRTPAAEPVAPVTWDRFSVLDWLLVTNLKLVSETQIFSIKKILFVFLNATTCLFPGRRSGSTSNRIVNVVTSIAGISSR